MNISRRLFVLTAAAGSGVPLQACGGGDDERLPDIVDADVITSNGVIHVVDKVLLLAA